MTILIYVFVNINTGLYIYIYIQVLILPRNKSKIPLFDLYYVQKFSTVSDYQTVNYSVPIQFSFFF